MIYLKLPEKARTETRLKMKSIELLILGLVFLMGCSSTIKRDPGLSGNILTHNRLWNIHKDVNHVYFMYEDGSIEKGILLRWEGENIQIQEKNQSLPREISATGVKSIKVVIGNRIKESLAAGTALAASYFYLAGADKIKGESYWEVGAKVFVSPLILITSIAYGAGIEKTEEYLIPDGFEFNFSDVDASYRLVK